MPHIWDIAKQSSTEYGLNVIIPISGEVSIEWANFLLRLQLPGNKGIKLHFHGGNPVDIAREMLVDKAMEIESSEWLFFLDSDVIPPENIIEVLMSHNLPIVGGIYNSKGPDLPWSMWNYVDGKQTPVKEWDKRIIQVDLTGFGCILVHKSVIQKMREMFKLPLFFWSLDRNPIVVDSLNVPDKRMMNVSEDMWFCLLAKACGYDINIDTEMMCGHTGIFKVDDGKISPPER